MTMDRMRRVSNVWNWLPAFRAVAEYESIQQAATVLNVSPSALSRTVRLLEDAIGEALFFRNSTGFVLTSFGAETLKGTRDAMRRIDDVLAMSATSNHNRNRIFSVGASGPVLPRLLDCAVSRTLSQDGNVRYQTRLLDEESIFAELLRGNLDVAIVEENSKFALPDGLTSHRVADLSFALMAPSGHPLAASKSSESAVVIEDTKVVCLTGIALGDPPSKEIIALASSMESAERMAAGGPFLALLPVALASPNFFAVAPSATRMKALVVYRTPISEQPRDLVRALIDAVLAVTNSA